tara:strand:+ start:104 stop:259 length:156 start_codon:yes stop_codon:yes gene_type:complete
MHQCRINEQGFGQHFSYKGYLNRYFKEKKWNLVYYEKKAFLVGLNLAVLIY